MSGSTKDFGRTGFPSDQGVLEEACRRNGHSVGSDPVQISFDSRRVGRVRAVRVDPVVSRHFPSYCVLSCFHDPNVP